VAVLVTRVRLPFLHVRIPAHVSARARTLIITASAAGSRTLVVDGHRFRLTQKAKHLKLRIRRGRKPLLLELSVTDQNVKIPFAVKVTRSRPHRG
jgi:hypothetical protein